MELIPNNRPELLPIAESLATVADNSGYEVSQVFSDWLIVTEMSLRMLPHHAISIAANGTFATDSPKDGEELTRIQERYGKEFEGIHAAFHAFLRLANPTLRIDRESSDRLARTDGVIRDYLGPLFEYMGKANSRLGQYFTPEGVCRLMVSLGQDSMEEKVYRAMEHALAQHPLSGVFFPATEGWITGDGAEALARCFLPAVLEHYVPPRVYDPCVGSGGLLLATAAQLPEWMLHLGLVQFYGNDVAIDCVLMSKINIMVYGLNGWGARYNAGFEVLEMALNNENSSDTGIDKESQIHAFLRQHPYVNYNPNDAIRQGNSLSEFVQPSTWDTAMKNLQQSEIERESALANEPITSPPLMLFG